MTKYNTGNPVGSSDPRDLLDNSQNADYLENGTAERYPDRLGKLRKSRAGMEKAFDDFLAASGYEFLGDYASGIEVTAYNQVIRDAGEFWRAAAGTELPYTTTGAGLPEVGKFVNVGDAALRQDLSSDPANGLGAAMVRGAIVKAECLEDLSGLPHYPGVQYSVLGYHRNSKCGGGLFYWDASMDKENHNGVSVIDPNKEFPADWSSRVDRVAWYFSVNSGSGCFVRKEEGELTLKDAGGISDWDGSTGSNNTQAYQALLGTLQNDSSVSIRDGAFLIDVFDDDLVPAIDSVDREYAVVLLSGSRNIAINGTGELHIKCDSSTKRVWPAIFKNSYSVNVFGLKVTGELVKQDAVPNSETGLSYGFMWYNCTGSNLAFSEISGVLVPFSMTGQPLSPATVADVTKRCTVIGNKFKNFEQCSTFGAGAAELIISNNHFHNGYTGFKISQNPVGLSAVGESGRITISDNVVDWSTDAEFAEVFFSPGNSQPAAGFMIESSSYDVLVQGNTVDFTNITIPSLPPITDPAPVVVFNADSPVSEGDALESQGVRIFGGVLKARDGYGDERAITATSRTKDLSVKGVSFYGVIRVATSAQPTETFESLNISDNEGHYLGSTPPIIVVSKGAWESVCIDRNTMFVSDGAVSSGDKSLLVVEGFTTKYLNIRGNTLPEGRVSNYGSDTVMAEAVDISDNRVIKAVDIDLTDTLSLTLDGNLATTDSKAYKVVLDAATKSDCIVVFDSACRGATGDLSGTALDINGGNLQLVSEKCAAIAANAFLFDSSVFIRAGSYYGAGAPTQPALFGCWYNDYNTGSNSTYIKTTPTGGAGWKKIATVD